MKKPGDTPVKHSKDRPNDRSIAYGYARCSTAEQIDGETLAIQEAQIRALAILHGYELAEIFVDGGVSGSKPLRQRPEGGKLWRALKPGQAIIAYRLDRAFRNQQDALATLEDCKTRGNSLILGDLGGDCTKGSVASLIFGVMSACSNFEKSRLIDRIVDAKQAQKARGEYLGGSAPFGYRIEEREDGVRIVVPDTELQATVFDLRRRGVSGRQISCELKKVGVSASFVTVCRFLREHPEAA
jgi:putative DNA-invertase from lambdoid prophage Rac